MPLLPFKSTCWRFSLKYLIQNGNKNNYQNLLHSGKFMPGFSAGNSPASIPLKGTNPVSVFGITLISLQQTGCMCIVIWLKKGEKIFRVSNQACPLLAPPRSLDRSLHCLNHELFCGFLLY
jgi:hypothetical protein